MKEQSYLPAGTILNSRYEIHGELGRGGISVVYDAFDRKAEHAVAVKLLIAPPRAANMLRERMRREAALINTLTHPNIVRALSFEESDGFTYVVMEKIDGRDLHQLVATRGALTSELVRTIGLEMAMALDAAHRKGILHRDVKPHNILVNSEGKALLADFGSARIEGEATLTALGGIVGSLDYLAPEVLKGSRADARADIYSLGLTLFYAVAGKLPDLAVDMRRNQVQVGHNPRNGVPGISHHLSKVIELATAKEVDQRFQTAHSMYEALKEDTLPLPRKPTLLAFQTEACLVCGAPDPLGFAVCSRCLLEHPKIPASTAVMLSKPQSRRELKEIKFQLADCFHLPLDSETVKEVTRGIRPLIVVPFEFAGTVIKQLSSANVKAYARPKSSLWQEVPKNLIALLLAVVMVNIYLGVIISPWFTWTGMVISIILFLLAALGVQKPLLSSQASSSPFSIELQQKIMQSIIQFPSGVARGLFVDLVRTAQAVLAPRLARSSLSTLELGSEVCHLVNVSCEASKDLVFLDKTLTRLEAQSKQLSSVPETLLDTLSACEKTRDSLAHHFLEAIAALTALCHERVVSSLGTVSGLRQLSEQFQLEVKVQAEVRQEIENLLA